MLRNVQFLITGSNGKHKKNNLKAIWGRKVIEKI